MPDEKKKTTEAEELKEKLEELTEEELEELDDEELDKLSGGVLSAESKKLILQKKVALCKG